MNQRLAIFPLGAVLFPGLVLRLHVFEERYRQLVGDLSVLPERERRFGVVAIRQGREVGEDAADANTLHQVGCIATVREVEPLDDGGFVVVTAGTQRFRVGHLDRALPYLQADVELLDEPPGDAADTAAIAVERLFGLYRRALTMSTEVLDLENDPELLSYVVAAATILDLNDKQALLEAPDTASRLRHEAALLRREIAVLSLLPSVPAVDLPHAETSAN